MKSVAVIGAGITIEGEIVPGLKSRSAGLAGAKN